MFRQPVKRLFATTEALAPTPPYVSIREIDRHPDVMGLAEKVRLTMAEALAATARPDIDYLAEGVAQHAVDCVDAPPEQMLRRLIADYDQALLLLAERQPLGEQRNLYRIVAQLSALVADELMALGKAQHTQPPGRRSPAAQPTKPTIATFAHMSGPSQRSSLSTTATPLSPFG